MKYFVKILQKSSRYYDYLLSVPETVLLGLARDPVPEL